MYLSPRRRFMTPRSINHRSVHSQELERVLEVNQGVVVGKLRLAGHELVGGAQGADDGVLRAQFPALLRRLAPRACALRVVRAVEDLVDLLGHLERDRVREDLLDVRDDLAAEVGVAADEVEDEDAWSEDSDDDDLKEICAAKTWDE